MTRNSQAAERAEAAFKKKEERLLDGEKAMAEYRADRRAVQDKTARLRALRLARDSADKDRKRNSSSMACDLPANTGASYSQW